LLILGFAGFTISQLVLVTVPENGYGLLLLSGLLEACSLATTNLLVDQMLVLTIDPKERARIQSILCVGIILITVPFGWIAGILSGLDKNFPFILNIFLFLVGGILAYLGQTDQPGDAHHAGTRRCLPCSFRDYKHTRAGYDGALELE